MKKVFMSLLMILLTTTVFGSCITEPEIKYSSRGLVIDGVSYYQMESDMFEGADTLHEDGTYEVTYKHGELIGTTKSDRTPLEIYALDADWNYIQVAFERLVINDGEPLYLFVKQGVDIPNIINYEVKEFVIVKEYTGEPHCYQAYIAAEGDEIYEAILNAVKEKPVSVTMYANNDFTEASADMKAEDSIGIWTRYHGYGGIESREVGFMKVEGKWYLRYTKWSDGDYSVQALYGPIPDRIIDKIRE